MHLTRRAFKYELVLLARLILELDTSLLKRFSCSDGSCSKTGLGKHVLTVNLAG